VAVSGVLVIDSSELIPGAGFVTRPPQHPGWLAIFPQAPHRNSIRQTGPQPSSRCLRLPKPPFPMTNLRAARERLEAIPSIRLGHLPTPIDDLTRLRQELGLGARLLAKRDDTLPFGFGGNKVRKLTLVAADALAQGADTLITCGAVQSNHCRATAAAAARLGLACHIVANGERPDRPTGNALLLGLFGAEVTYVGTRDERTPGMEHLAAQLRARGRRPYVIPLGASNPLGAMAIARGIGEMVSQGIVPDVIVHSTSSGGTQAGLVAGCVLYETRTRVIGVSADSPAAEIRRIVNGITDGVEERLGLAPGTLGAAERCEVDDTMTGGGYGVPSDASREAQRLAARSEAILVDHWYTAKALAGLIARGRRGEFPDGTTVLFWHTGGQVGVLA
jgi:1-aminocyclopropane-1-carboxylate deaminase/D-cysteine desulfhydrase-like pyridoxal-dependent ACC family enzyme